MLKRGQAPIEAVSEGTSATMTGTYAETFPHNTSCSHALPSSSWYHYWIAATTRLGAAEESGIRRGGASVWIRQDHGWREDRLDLISDRSGGGVPSMQETETADEEEPIATKAADGRRRHHQIISHSGNPTFLQFLQFLGPPSPSLLRSFHPSHSRSYVRSISYPALRSNPSDPTYSKAAAAAMPCSMLPLPVVPSLRRHYSDSIPAGNKLNRPAGSAAGDEANFCRIFRRSDSMSSHVNSMNFYVVSIEYAPLVAWCKENAGNLRPRAKAFHFHEVHSWRASQFDSPCPPRHEDVAFPLSRAELLRMFVEVLVLPDTQSWLLLFLSFMLG